MEPVLNEQELSLKLFVVFSRANRAVTDRIKEDIKSYGLNPTEFAVLELLYHKGDQPIQNIGKKILLTSGSMTYVVDQLEKKKLLIRKQCKEDRRIIYASITEEGRARMDDIFPKHRKAIKETFSSLNPEEQQQMIQLLKKLGLSLDNH
ncbi:MarR family winged helix-turn-helix transcriptional regulator [Paenibacillus sp. J2TS4]|uniref:MarR family winged helix-turn-helix transcriptional regulator n=1 Tax=Paenibacillus sp. J2TS4 TaxID=2807194 RepID=UPI001B219BF4|nr:MarR family transcriptional regulator [Paenibacillus sp. J2TS4]GIP34031.1 MarR family transcriptional regulator [Paenibacillus sp. J2TS4]